MGRLARIAATAAALAAAALALAGCDSNARLSPDFLKLAAPPVAEAEPAPDARRIVRDNLATMFLAQSAPKNVAVSRLERRGGYWTSCVRATVSGMTNRVAVQTYAITFERGKIIRRERIEPSHWCATETFEPI